MRVKPSDVVGKFIFGETQSSKFLASAETGQWILDLNCGEVFRGYGFDLTGLGKPLNMFSQISHLIEFHQPIIPLSPVIELTQIRIIQNS